MTRLYAESHALLYVVYKYTSPLPHLMQRRSAAAACRRR